LHCGKLLFMFLFTLNQSREKKQMVKDYYGIYYADFEAFRENMLTEEEEELEFDRRFMLRGIEIRKAMLEIKKRI